jgi:hypothetical protein
MTESVRTLWLAATLICLIANHGGVVGMHGVYADSKIPKLI